MQKVVLYIACSLDGYIADVDGGIGFLDETPSPQPDLDYENFYNSVGALIMGGKTYRQIVTELSPNQWPYEGKSCYVYTKSTNREDKNVQFTNLPPEELLKQIKLQTKDDIWMVGGGEVIKIFLEQNLIDHYYIYLMPVMLGEGISLFPKGFPKTQLKLVGTRSIGEIVEIEYCKK